MKTQRAYLSQRQRCCISVAALYTLNQRHRARRFLVQLLRSHHLPTRFLHELFIHLSLVLGFPAMLEGFDFVSTIRPAARPSGHTRRQGGKAVLHRIYGKQTRKLLQHFDRLHPEARGMIVNEVYGRVFTRPGLSLKERELINLTVLSLQGFERQVYSHVRGALRAGVSVESLTTAMTRIEKETHRRMTRARRILRSVVSQGKKL